MEIYLKQQAKHTLTEELDISFKPVKQRNTEILPGPFLKPLCPHDTTSGQDSSTQESSLKNELITQTMYS